MRVLGLDPSLTNYGWAIHDTDAEGRDRCPERGRFQTSSKTVFVERYIDLRAAVRDLVQRVQPDRCGVEFPVFHELYSEGMYGLFLYTCEALKAEGQDVVFWSNGQIKAHARESLGLPPGWKMGKANMVDAAKADVGGGRWNHNEADAYLAGRLAARFWLLYQDDLLERELTPTERKYFLAIHRHVRGRKAGRVTKSGALYREDERFFLWSREK
jgi:hypothetical protein